MKQVIIILSLIILAVSIPVAFAEEIAIPISNQESVELTGGSITTTITGNYTTMQATDVSNRSGLDLVGVQAIMNMYENGTLFCTVTSSIDILAGGTGTFVWACPVEGIADEASGTFLSYAITSTATTSSESTSSNSTSSTTTSTSSTTTSTATSSSSSDDSTIHVVINTDTYTIDDHQFSIIMEEYQGTQKFVQFTGGNFTTSETISIDVTDPNDVLRVAIQTMVTGSGEFSVPAIVNTNDLVGGEYIMTIDATISGVYNLTLQWNGDAFTFTGIALSESSSTTASTTTSSDTTSTTTSTTSSTVSDWNQYVLDLDVADRLDLIKAVFSYLFN